LDEADEKNYYYTEKMIEDTENSLEEAYASLEEFKQSIDVSTLEQEKNRLEQTEEPRLNTKESEEEVELGRKIEEAQTTGNNVLAQIQTMENEVSRKKREQAQLDTQTVCNYCGAPLDASHAEKEFERLTNEIASLLATINSTKEMFNQQFKPMLAMMKENKQAL